MTDSKPLLPGLIHSLASVAPGAARLIRPPAKLLKINVPSDVAVMLSAKSCGNGTSTGSAASTAVEKPAVTDIPSASPIERSG